MTVATLNLPETTRERGALIDPLAQRMLAVLQQVLAGASIDILKEAAAAPTGAGSLAVLVSHLPETSPVLAAADPEAAAVARAARAKQELLARTPTYSTKEVAGLLGITAEGVRKQRLSGKLLALEHASDWRFPRWQFTRHGVLRGLQDVLSAMPVESPWVRLEMLITPFDEQEFAEPGQTVLDLLRAGNAKAAVAIVTHYGEQGA